MKLNIANIIAFLVILFLVLGFYYIKFLTVDEGENKKLKMLKRILVFMVIIGFIHIYSIARQDDIKLIMIVFFAVVLNIYSVVHSTKKCDYPKLYVIQLSLFTAMITIISAGILWYSTRRSLFGFMIDDSDDEESIEEEAVSIFTSNEIDQSLGLYDQGPGDCPIPDIPEGTNTDYDSQMRQLRTEDLDKFNACLEREIREDLERES